MVDRIWLDVPFAEKDEAKELGARWSPDAKRWFAPRPGMTRLERWAALPDVPDLLPGENRTLGSGLFVDLVPATCWFTNVRSCVSPKDWERLRRMITRRAGMRCEICGAAEDRPTRRWLEAHERWVYDDAHGTQTLARLICLCTDCHTVTHFGFAQVRGLEEAAYLHLMAVTGMNQATAYAHVQDAFALWETRSARTWDLDLSLFTDAGVSVRRPPTASERPAAVQAAFVAIDDGIKERAAQRLRANGIRQRAEAREHPIPDLAAGPGLVMVSTSLEPVGEVVQHTRPARTTSWLQRLMTRLRGEQGQF
ncbi:DUF5710 domain-containing protein [Promicromonospora sp. MS192]|uniref:DUF5710 domain-containing protein n=1 Tax=Promicromonospora sp. MS192 TaxID=3412684 RepID=UPI003C2F8F8B